MGFYIIQGDTCGAHQALAVAFSQFEKLEIRAQRYLIDHTRIDDAKNFESAIGLHHCDMWVGIQEDADTAINLLRIMHRLVTDNPTSDLFAFKYGDGFAVYIAPSIPQLLTRLTQETNVLLQQFGAAILDCPLLAQSKETTHAS